MELAGPLSDRIQRETSFLATFEFRRTGRASYMAESFPALAHLRKPRSNAATAFSLSLVCADIPTSCGSRVTIDVGVQKPPVVNW